MPFLVPQQHLYESMRYRGLETHPPEQGPSWRSTEPELLVDPSVAPSERYEAVQGEGRHCRIYVGIVMNPVLVIDGEHQACSKSCGAKSGWVVHINIDINMGHGPCKNVCARPFATYQHVLQRPDILGSMSVSRNIRKEFKSVFWVRIM